MERNKAPSHAGTHQDKSAPSKDQHAKPQDAHKEQGHADKMHAPTKKS